MSRYYEYIAQEWPLFTKYTGERIVRCRDCTYNAKDTDGICYRFDHEHFNQPDGFCAWGKRKEGCEMILCWSDMEDGDCFVCSECNDYTYSHGLDPKFCQNCGAQIMKVVKQ